MFNIGQIKYSIIHTMAINMLGEKRKVAETLLEEMKYHDMDKVLNYMVSSIFTAHRLHIINSNHHLESSIQKHDTNLIETVLDWEIARYTKSDKPLNAYQTLNKYYSEYKDVILPVLKDLNLDNDNTQMDREIVEKINNINLSNEDILNYVISYINYLKDNRVETYYDLKEIVLRIYQSLSKEEQLYFKSHMDSDYINPILKSKRKRRIGLFTHNNADYDAISSTLSLASYISFLTNDEDIEVIPVIEPTMLLQKVKNNLKVYTEEEAKEIDFDDVIICDVNEQDRVYGLDLINKVEVNRRYIIDHHDKNRVEVETLKTNKMVLPSYSSTCEIITELLIFDGFSIPRDMAYNLYCGMASDTSLFERNVTLNTEKMVNYLELTEQEKKDIQDDMNKMTPKQERLYDRIKVIDSGEDIKIYTLLEPIEAGDITKYLKHKKFDQLTGPTKENPITCFIVGCGNNYFLKLKKIPNCEIDLLTIAINCNGGGHENRCAGRFYDTDFQTVFNKLIEEYRSAKEKMLNNNDGEEKKRKLFLQ